MPQQTRPPIRSRRGTVTRLLTVEPEPHLRELAVQSARSAAVPVQVVDGRAEQLPAEDASFDAAVACLPLCSVAELHRMLRPGGQLRFFEHVRADSPAMRRVQRALDATIWPLLMAAATSAATPRPRSSAQLSANPGHIVITLPAEGGRRVGGHRREPAGAQGARHAGGGAAHVPVDESE